ncbi:anti-repressor SinI family protein [Alkalihalobacillus sp. LMS39]|nr:anti-repressor SinI family protein [Alkalihalobacillus sp. LMS39]UOE95600.1 anti-repressor SinI family protein [Alkalihalobacillus sp. LMS39]
MSENLKSHGSHNDELDQEWVILMKIAIQQGLSPEEVRQFIHEKRN